MLRPFADNYRPPAKPGHGCCPHHDCDPLSSTDLDRIERFIRVARCQNGYGLGLFPIVQDLCVPIWDVRREI